MDKQLRQSLPAKFTAIGFIVVILSGNFWLVLLLLNQQPSKFIVYSMELGVVLTLCSGLCLFALNMYRKITLGKDQSE